MVSKYAKSAIYFCLLSTNYGTGPNGTVVSESATLHRNWICRWPKLLQVWQHFSETQLPITCIKYHRICCTFNNFNISSDLYQVTILLSLSRLISFECVFRKLSDCNMIRADRAPVKQDEAFIVESKFQLFFCGFMIFYGQCYVARVVENDVSPTRPPSRHGVPKLPASTPYSGENNLSSVESIF